MEKRKNTFSFERIKITKPIFFFKKTKIHLTSYPSDANHPSSTTTSRRSPNWWPSCLETQLFPPMMVTLQFKAQVYRRFLISIVMHCRWNFTAYLLKLLISPSHAEVEPRFQRRGFYIQRKLRISTKDSIFKENLVERGSTLTITT